MGLAISDEHLELAQTARRWLEARDALASARASLAAEHDARPAWWSELAGLGWLGLAVSEANGGQGYGLPELAVVLEETGRACLPGPFLPTALVAYALDRWGDDPTLVRALVDGTKTAGLAFGTVLDGRFDGSSGEARISGTAQYVWSGATADVVLVAATDGFRFESCVVDRAGATVRERASFDPTRRLAEVSFDGAEVAPGRWLRRERTAGNDVHALLGPLVGVLAGAEAIGLAQWCVETAAEHARTRVQFGRPIGQFQAVKHRCADMLVAVEAARAAVWDAARCFDEPGSGWEVAAGTAGALAPQAAFRCAKDCIQVLGGIGYTWEHDAHLFLKRATAMRHLTVPPDDIRAMVADAVASGARRTMAFDLPPEAEPLRARTRAFVADLQARPKDEWNGVLADSGYQVPHWPAPWGLDASPIEQLVIDQEFALARIRRRHLQVAGWVLPTIIGHGTVEQQERWVPASLRGEITWCQMFSEPDAGSDLASLTTRAVRVAGGWSITGQKVWTTMAQLAQWAICLARTDPAAPKHEGIGCFMVDMTTPGIEIRPLRELTGMAMFNEVFLTDVFVPDDCVVGSPTGGWEAARTTLANERVSMSSGSSFGPGVASLFDLATGGERADPATGVPTLLQRDLVLLGGLVVDAHAIAALGVRTTLRALSGGRPGPEASVRKLLGVEHEQAVQEAGLTLLGPEAAVVEGQGAAWTGGFLGNRALSIAGGTSEIQRNLIAERLLGLPKDP